MSLYVMSDTHLSTSVDKPMEVFGLRWDNYHERIKENWQSIIDENDTVIIPGDVSWGMSLNEALDDLLFLDSLKGKKLLGKGNHDYWWDTVTKMKRFLKENGITSIDFLYNNSYLIENIAVCGSRGWYNEKKLSPSNTDYSKIVLREAARIELSIQDSLKKSEITPYVFLHFPPVFGDYECREIIDVLHKYNIKKCYYGHIHNVYDVPKTMLFEDIEFTIVSADYLNFLPEKII